jgi:hypothetical protein
VRVVRHAAAGVFLHRAGAWLSAREAEHNVILGDAHLLLTEDHPFREPIYFATVDDGASIVGCAVRPPPDGLTLTRMPSEAVPLLVEDVARVYDVLPAVAGPAHVATEFARLWTQGHRCRWSIAVQWHGYEADRIEELDRPAPGFLRLATADDWHLVRAWASAYARDVGTTVDVEGFFARRIRTESLYLWIDGEARSLVAVSGLTPTSARISGVYTPPAQRRRGYATAAVAEVSRLVLSGGRRLCMLFADAKDPTANSIYRKIGYAPICDVWAIRFD